MRDALYFGAWILTVRQQVKDIGFLLETAVSICEDARNMNRHEEVICRLEDFILAERNLKTVGNIPFEPDGKEVLGYPYIRASNRSIGNALGELEWLLEKPAKDIRFLEVGCGRQVA